MGYGIEVGPSAGGVKPLCIDLFCGLGGWADGFLAEGYDVFGFDIERHDYGTGGYPGDLVLQDVLTLDGAQFRDAAVIVASPPCQKYSYMAMPWTRAKLMVAEYRSGVRSIEELNALFNACFRIQREANEATACDCGHYPESHYGGTEDCMDCSCIAVAGQRYIPLIVENVRGAQPWVGCSRWHYGSFHLWGDVPALMPITALRKTTGNSPQMWKDRERSHWDGSYGLKVQGQDWNRFKKTGEVSPDWHSFKTIGHVNKRDGHTHTRHLTAQFESDEVREGRKGAGAGAGAGAAWFDQNLCTLSSKSRSRKAASAQIAKIPFPLARHIARCFKPQLRALAEVSSS